MATNSHENALPCSQNLLEQLCRCQGRRSISDHLHACIRRRHTGGGAGGCAAGRDRAPGQAGVVVMAGRVDLRAHRTGRVRHEVLGTAFNGADDVRGSDIAAHARIGHDRASKVGVLTTCRRGTAKRGALTASEAETDRHVHEPAPGRPCRRGKESSKRLEGHGAGSCSNDLHGHRKGARCKEQALECLMPNCFHPDMICAKQEVTSTCQNSPYMPESLLPALVRSRTRHSFHLGVACGYGAARRAMYSNALPPNVAGRRGPSCVQDPSDAHPCPPGARHRVAREGELFGQASQI